MKKEKEREGGMGFRFWERETSGGKKDKIQGVRKLSWMVVIG